MKRSLAGCLALALLWVGTAAPVRAELIELADGSVVNGEVVSLRDGIYTIRTESLGTLMVDEARIRCIHLGPGQSLPAASPAQPGPGRPLPPAASPAQPGPGPARPPASSLPALPGGPGASVLPGAAALQARILNDPRLMQSILSLQNDPEIMQFIQDPATLQALMSGDVNALMDDPRFMRLMDNPGLQRVQQDLMGSGTDR